MPRRTPAKRPVVSSNGTRDEQQSSVAAVRELADEQTLADSDQTLSDGDQTLSETDQTSADSDQTTADSEQLASDRDQAASDRDLEAGGSPRVHEVSREVREHSSDQRERTAEQREHSAHARLEAAAGRDSIAQARDLAALARDRAADARDLAMAQVDAVVEQDAGLHERTGSDRIIRAAGARKRAAQRRAHVAEQRALTAKDRHAAAADREQSARERLRALVDREALSREVAIVETDRLTGARTRAAGLTNLDQEVDRCRRSSGRVVVVFVSVEGLKPVNDAEGQHAGDELLKGLVGLIKKDLRSYDLIIRLGGDEFLIALSNTTLAEARRRFGALASGSEPGAIRTGFAELTAGETADQLIARAEHELAAGRSAGPSSRESRPEPLTS